MNASVVVILVATVFCAVQSKPLDSTEIEPRDNVLAHTIEKRFINPSLTVGGFSGNEFSKIRAKRSLEEECEKLRLCKLHARSSRNFFAAFELYFVNKENARLWDHQVHSVADCEQRYSCYR